MLNCRNGFGRRKIKEKKSGNTWCFVDPTSRQSSWMTCISGGNGNLYKKPIQYKLQFAGKKILKKLQAKENQWEKSRIMEPPLAHSVTSRLTFGDLFFLQLLPPAICFIFVATKVDERIHNNCVVCSIWNSNIIKYKTPYSVLYQYIIIYSIWSLLLFNMKFYIK